MFPESLNKRHVPSALGGDLGGVIPVKKAKGAGLSRLVDKSRQHESP
jgi:hypothetical protein